LFHFTKQKDKKKPKKTGVISTPPKEKEKPRSPLSCRSTKFLECCCCYRRKKSEALVPVFSGKRKKKEAGTEREGGETL
jgi:hypothetical protein